MIKGIGCDIVEIARFVKKQEQLAQKILTTKEKACYDALCEQRKVTYLAGRFAAKEAIYKALGDTTITISNIEVLNDAKGKPVCEIQAGVMHISISHEKDYALAYAMYEV